MDLDQVFMNEVFPGQVYRARSTSRFLFCGMKSECQEEWLPEFPHFFVLTCGTCHWSEVPDAIWGGGGRSVTVILMCCLRVSDHTGC